MRESRRAPIACAVILLSSVALISCTTMIPDSDSGRIPQTGVRLVYSFNFEEAERAGLIGLQELNGKPELLHELSEVIVSRIESAGMEGVRVSPFGSDTIAVELMGEAPDRVAQVKSLIQIQGLLEFGIIASDSDEVSLAAERDRFGAWMNAHPQATASEYNKLPANSGGPNSALRWIPIRQEELVSGAYFELTLGCVPLLVQDRLRPQLADGAGSWDFQGDDLQYAGPTIDQAGFPAVAFEFHEGRKQAFGDFTEAYVNRTLAMVVNGVVFTAPNINSRLPGGGIILGGRQGFELAERNALVCALRSGPLRVAPQLKSERVVEFAPILAK